MMKTKRVCTGYPNSNANRNNETNYCMRMIDDYCMACCTHFTSSCVSAKQSIVKRTKGQCEKKNNVFSSHTLTLTKIVEFGTAFNSFDKNTLTIQ